VRGSAGHGLATRPRVEPVVAPQASRGLGLRRVEWDRYRPLRGRLLAPVKVGLAFSLLTYLLFAFGVWNFPGRHSPQLALWVLAFNLAMYAGFRTGVRNRPRKRVRVGAERTAELVERLIRVAFVTTLVTFIPRLVIETQLYGLGLDDLVSRVRLGLDDALNVYQRRATSVQPPAAWVYVNYLCVATGFIAWLYTPLAILFWQRLSAWRRVLTIAFWAAAIVSATARGQNYGVFDLGIRIVVFVLIRRYFIGRESTAATRSAGPAPARRRLRVGQAVTAAALALVMVGFFTNTMRSRVGDQYDRLLAVGGQYVTIDQHSPIWVICPEALRPVWATLLAYVTHGYMGLGLSLRMPFDTTLGLGNSLFLIDNVKQMLGIDLLPLTYQDKVFAEYGYHYSILWHTAYTWLANDVSFWGVPVVLFWLLHVFGSGWSDFVLSRNLFGVLLMAPMATMMSFISANNQLTSNPNSLAAMIVLTLCWSATRDRYDWAGAFQLLEDRAGRRA